MRVKNVRPAASGRCSLLLRRSCLGLLGLVTLLLVPSWLCGWGAGDLYDGRVDSQLLLARAAARGVRGELRFHTGSPRFDGEWALVTLQMTVLGLGQVVREHPETRDELGPVMDAAVERLLAPEVLRFGTEPWHMASLDGALPTGNTGAGRRVPLPAWVGYVNTALGMHRLVVPSSRFAALHDRLTRGLAERLRDEPLPQLATYPDETYPPDLSTVAGSIGLWARATGRHDHDAVLRAWLGRFRTQAVDARTGLVLQALDSRTGTPVDKPRASGTAFSAYFLSFADAGLSRDLFEALRTRCVRRVAGFGVVYEYPPTVDAGAGDVDSGPVICGVGSSATAFAIASSRMHGDRALFVDLLRTGTLLGAPVERAGSRSYLLGGSLANAVMLAMTTARLPEP